MSGRVHCKTVALVPARAGSKRVTGKNLRRLGGHPLVAYAIAAARASAEIDDVVVTTDSPEIAEVARRYGASVPFLRPAHLSGDDSLDIDFFNHYLGTLSQRGITPPELIVHLRPSTPLRDPRVVDQAVRFLRVHPQLTSLRSMHRTSQTPYKMFRREGAIAQPFMTLAGERESYNLPRQRFEDAYEPNGCVDVIRPSVLASTGLLHGGAMAIWETEPVPDIDEPADLQRAEQLLSDARFAALRATLESQRCHAV